MGWLVEYEPGTDVLVVAGQCVIVLPEGTPVAIRSRAWELADAGVGILDVLEALSVHGAGPVNDAAVVVEDSDGCVALLRGGMTVVTDQGSFGARSRYTWTEDQVGSRTLTVRSRAIPVDPVSVTEWLPIRAGMVRCGAVRVVRGQGAPPDAAVVAEVHATPPELSGADTGPAPEPLHVEGDTGPAPEPLLGEDDAGVQAPLGPEQDSTAVLPVAAAVDWAEPRTAPGTGAAEQGSGEAEPEDDYDRLFGATSMVARRVPAAPTEEPLGGLPGSPVQEEPPTPVAEVPVADVPVVAAPVESGVLLGQQDQPGAGLIDFVPGLGPADRPDPVQAEPPIGSLDGLVGDHDGRTVLRSSRPRGPGMTVRAILCPSGHANPPEAVACRVCRMDVGDAPIQTISRPAVGVLRIEARVEGAPDTIPLERSVVVGRNPATRAPGSDQHDANVVIDVPGGELSRNHVRFTLEGWHVLVTDLGSTNGTVVTLPGRNPTRLRRGEATPITPGTVITLAETVSYRFQVQ